MSLSSEDRVRLWLAKALVLVENGEKRLPSLVVEHFFETSLLPYLVKGRKPMTGWFRFRMGHEKLWGYISAKDPSVDVVKTAGILLGTHEIDDIYFFTYSVQKKERKGNAPVGFSMQVRSFRHDKGRWSRFLGQSISCSTRLLDIVDMFEETTDAALWFYNNFDSRTLGKLVITRLVMNHALCSMWPIDIDGLLLCEDALHFMEFKRKNPARKYFLFSREIENVNDAINECRTLAGEIHGKIDRNKTDGENYNSIVHLLEESGRRKIDSPAFGLDTSHLQTLSLCMNNGFAYDYVIWEKKMKGETRSGKFIEQIHKLFHENTTENSLVPVAPFRLLSRRLSDMESMFGFLFTLGKDSSGLNGAGRGKQRTRVQVAVPEEEFEILIQR